MLEYFPAAADALGSLYAEVQCSSNFLSESVQWRRLFVCSITKAG
jgi:hypothetical protein